MTFCKNCGAVLGVGRFCTNCGTPVSPSAGVVRSAEESAVEKTNVRLPAVQPDASTGSRFPLFAADQGGAGDAFRSSIPAGSARGHGEADPSGAGPGAPPWLTGASTASAAHSPVVSHRGEEESRGGRPAWVIPLVLALIGVVALGIWLGNRGDSPGTTGADGSLDSSVSPSPGQDSEPPADDVPSPTAPPEPTGPPVDLTDRATATGPEPIAPGVDLAGDPVVYPVENVLDGDATTAYRMAGDASGESITVALPAGTTVLEVGLVNGYAKKDSAGNRTVDWYDRNRRILQVEWIFDDGTSVSQELSRTKDMQVLAVNNIDSSKVIMRIVEVSAKPSGELAKDVTAISEVVVRGRVS